ncbi:hypothetical protein BS50DRAFT_633847 [Corynespora cassiicola Philippines]|uniref:Uncharacterized protein n=1 Tax=Corynespora cassiicola Philippines TaxID=1448308 RepID=A0A2T2NS75_CORCC|nr:hypothetical protein BS50DRAFT_633847 [Corynespora cassiicola Philippines]
MESPVPREMHDWRDAFDTIPPDVQIRLLKQDPSGRFLTAEIRRQMLRDGAVPPTDLRELPRGIILIESNSLPRHLWERPSLIDYDRWEKVREEVARQGRILPCDYVEEEDVSHVADQFVRSDVHECFSTSGRSYVVDHDAGPSAASLLVKRRIHQRYEREDSTDWIGKGREGRKKRAQHAERRDEPIQVGEIVGFFRDYFHMFSKRTIIDLTAWSRS